MKEKLHEDGIKAAKTPSMIYCAKLKDNILWIHTWQNKHQRSVNNFRCCINGNFSGDWFSPFLNEISAGFIGKREWHTLSARFCK
jgi:hypothetical protein